MKYGVRKVGNYYDQAPEEVERDPQWLYNVDALGDSPEWVIFVDRQDDTDALVECNLDYVVSFDGDPSGAALRDNWELLSKPTRVILAGSKDAPSRREELARRLGRHRCFTVAWPDGCRNARETLDKLDAGAVRDLLDNAEPYPIAGLYKPTAAVMLGLRGLRPPETMTTGTAATDAILHLPTEGRVIVVTGYPACGKTAWTRFVMMHTAQVHGRRWAVFSPEMMPWEQFAADCSEVITGRSFWPEPMIDSMTIEEIASVGAWLEKRLTMLVCDSEDEAPTIEWILARARDAVLRDGVTDVLLDPWNEADHTRPERMTETDYIGRSLQRFKAFCVRHGVNMWIIAHPAKPIGTKTGEAKPPPGPYDIAASAHWANKPDLGITVHSTEQGKSLIWIWKARFRRFGLKDATAELDYNPFNGRYSNPIGDIAPAPDWRKPYNEEA